MKHFLKSGTRDKNEVWSHNIWTCEDLKQPKQQIFGQFGLTRFLNLVHNSRTKMAKSFLAEKGDVQNWLRDPGSEADS
jgi:hypothetical protein